MTENKSLISVGVVVWNVSVIYRAFVEMSVTLVLRVPWARVVQTTLTSFPGQSPDCIP